MSTTTSPSTFITLPAPLRTALASFPLHTYPAIPASPRPRTPAPATIWIHPPLTDLLSADVECLKWQAYVALRGVEGPVRVRWDVKEEGGVGGRLPSLWVPVALGDVEGGGERGERENGGELLPAHLIPAWVDREKGVQGRERGELEGYRDVAARDESRAWVALLEGTVHSALITFHPTAPTALATTLTPPPAPLTGLTSLFPPYGVHVPAADLEIKYAEAVAALSERLGGDRWFLGSAAPTPLDALAFAYLHTILHTYKLHQTLRTQMTRRVNLVAWERRVSGMVRAAFVKAGEV